MAGFSSYMKAIHSDADECCLILQCNICHDLKSFNEFVGICDAQLMHVCCLTCTSYLVYLETQECPLCRGPFMLEANVDVPVYDEPVYDQPAPVQPAPVLPAPVLPAPVQVPAGFQGVPVCVVFGGRGRGGGG